MRRYLAPMTLLFVLSVTLALTVAAPAQAEDAACSAVRAAGTYGVSDSGTVVGIGPRAAVALLTLDAAGNIKGKVTASLNGSVTNGTLSGTFTVNPDCTGTTTFGEFDPSGNLMITATVALVWDNNMREFRFLFISAVLPDQTALATVISGDAVKIVP